MFDYQEKSNIALSLEEFKELYISYAQNFGEFLGVFGVMTRKRKRIQEQ